MLAGRFVALKVHTDVPFEGTPLSLTMQKGSVYEAVAVAFSLVEEAALLPQVTGRRHSHGFSKASRVLPACHGCSKLAPLPAVLAVPHPQTIEPSITGAFRRESAARLCNTSWPLCHQPLVCASSSRNGSGRLCMDTGGMCQSHLWAGQELLATLPACSQVLGKDIPSLCWSQLLCSEPNDLAWTSLRWEIQS